MNEKETPSALETLAIGLFIVAVSVIGIDFDLAVDSPGIWMPPAIFLGLIVLLIVLPE